MIGSGKIEVKIKEVDKIKQMKKAAKEAKRYTESWDVKKFIDRSTYPSLNNEKEEKEEQKQIVERASIIKKDISTD